MASLLRLRRCIAAVTFNRSYTSSGIFFKVSVVGMACTNRNGTKTVPFYRLAKHLPTDRSGGNRRSSRLDWVVTVKTWESFGLDVRQVLRTIVASSVRNVWRLWIGVPVRNFGFRPGFACIQGASPCVLS